MDLTERFLSNTGLVGFSIKQLGYSFTEDYIQSGYEGLWRACLNYKEEQGTFATYAISYIRGYIQKEKARQLGVKKLNDEALKNKPITVSLENEIITDRGTAELKDLVGKIDDRIDYIDLKESLEKCLTEEEFILLGVITKEISQKEAATYLGYAQPTISRKCKKLKVKLYEELV